jgi:hypothetical protein
MKVLPFVICVFAFVMIPFSPLLAADKNRAWSDPDVAAKEDPDFLVQGEYGVEGARAVVGVQVVALGGGSFDAYVLEGGLPGAGWENGKKRVVWKGARKDGTVVFASPDGKGSGEIRDGALHLALEGETKIALPRLERKSPTLGATPPKGAVVLFDGSSADQWEKGKVENGLLAATGCISKPKFRDYTFHAEFRTPYKPFARGQGRGNSGIYYGGRWETQVLDSFGLDGKQNECGGIYSIAPPRLNMCLPPLTWQTYDVEFKAARFDAGGGRIAWPRITVKLNGVLIHENLELGKHYTTAVPLTGDLKDEPGPIYLQAHGNPVFFRNIWVLPVQ